MKARKKENDKLRPRFLKDIKEALKSGKPKRVTKKFIKSLKQG